MPDQSELDSLRADLLEARRALLSFADWQLKAVAMTDSWFPGFNLRRSEVYKARAALKDGE